MIGKTASTPHIANTYPSTSTTDNYETHIHICLRYIAFASAFESRSQRMAQLQKSYNMEKADVDWTWSCRSGVATVGIPSALGVTMQVARRTRQTETRDSS